MRYLNDIRSPCLVVHCQEDDVQTEADTRLYSDSIPGAQFCKIPGGHFALEKKDSQNDIIPILTEFLSTL